MKGKLFGFLALLFTLPCFAQTSHLEYSEDCMDRYIYQLDKSKNSESFVSYRLKMGLNQYAILEVGKDEGKRSFGRPQGIFDCKNYPITRRMVQDINTGKRKLYIVRKGANGYYNSLVKKADYYYMIGSELDYTSKDADFSFNLAEPEYNKNLATAQSKKMVMLDGVDFAQCKKAYVLRKADDLRSKSYKEYTFTPEFGFLEKRSVILSKNKTQVNIIRLKSINGNPVEDVINYACSEQQAEIFDRPEPQPVVTSYDSFSGRVNTSPSLTNRGSAPCPNFTREGWHVVKTGETLYGISRRYSISLAQLRSWNGLQNSNTISPCQELKVTVNAGKTTTAQPDVVTRPPATTTPTPPVTRGEVTTKPADANPYPYTGYRPNSTGNTNTTRPTTTTNPTATARPRPTYDNTYSTAGKPLWVNAGDYHTVLAGETAASIANAYGFTESRFRYMNGLGEREKVYQGQTMRITICEQNKSVGNAGRPQPYNNESSAIVGYGVYSNANETYVAPRSGQAVNYRVHIVQNGESLFSIARDYGTSVERVREINNLSPGEVILQSQRIYIDK